MKRIALPVCCVAASAVFAAVTSTNTWDYSVNTGNTSPDAAALWTDVSNWQKDTVPDGAQWKAVLTGASSMRYISVPGPLTLGSFVATRYQIGSADGTVVMSDSPITFDNSSGNYNIYGGRIYADIVTDGTQSDGVLDDTEIAGRINFGANGMFYLASRVAYHRLDHYAVSSNPVRTDDFTAYGIYKGSGYMKVYGPRSGEAHAEEWNVTAGSPFVTRSSTTPAIAAGAVVTCEGVFPAGTFVKRIFSDSCIELSSAASGETGSGAKTLSFAAIKPSVTYTIPVFRMNSDSLTYTSFVKHAQDDDMRVVISNMISAAAKVYPFHPHVDDSGKYPATIVIHDAAYGTDNLHQYAAYMLVWLGNCHLEFAETGREGAKSGFPDSTARSYDRYSTTRITVTNGIEAAIGLVTNFMNTISKDGGGSLELGLTNDVSRNTGTIVVKEGTVVLPEGSWVKTVAISNGAALKISGLFAPDSLITAPGARICGTGTIVMDDTTCLSGVVFEDDVKVKFRTNTNGGFVRDIPEYKVVGTPAFWIDATRTDKMTFKDGDGVTIARVDDIRKTAENDGYLFATNHTLYPTLANNGDGSAHNIDLGARISSATSAEQVRDLFWSEPITNIWAIFMVQDTSRGGGQFLGSSSRLKALLKNRASDFVRDAGAAYTGDVFYRGNSGTYQRALIEGLLYCNGILRHPYTGYPYKGGLFSVNGGTSRYAPHVTEAHPTKPVAADCFAFDSGVPNRNGNKRVCEMIIYTNKLTQAERLAVCGYLMDKWLGCDVTCDVQTNLLASLSLSSPSPRGLVIDAGELMYAGKMSGAGRFAKFGDGTMYVDCLDGGSADLTVSGGVLEVNSRSVPTAADIPSDNLLFRMDATRKDLMTTVTNNGLERIAIWKSTHDGNVKWTRLNQGGSSASTNSAIYRANMLNGNAMLDFGEAFKVEDAKANSSMRYSRVTIRSVFMVQNTSNGGSSVVGDGSTWSAGGMMREGWYRGRGASTVILTGDFSDWSNLLALVNQGSDRDNALKGGRMRLNGELMNLGVDGYSGGDDLLGYVSYYPITSNAYGHNNGHGDYCGGGMLGEYIAYSRGLSDRDALKVEAYLRKKWFNADTPGFTPAVASNLTVAAGATLNISGDAPMTVKGTFSGGGTVSGALALAADAVIEVAVEANDTIQPVTVAGTVDLSNGGIVRLVGDARRLRGDYTLVSCPSLTEASAGTWTVEFAGARDSACKYVAFVADGAFVLRVMPPGTTVIFR